MMLFRHPPFLRMRKTRDHNNTGRCRDENLSPRNETKISEIIAQQEISMGIKVPTNPQRLEERILINSSFVAAPNYACKK